MIKPLMHFVAMASARRAFMACRASAPRSGTSLGGTLGRRSLALVGQRIRPDAPRAANGCPKGPSPRERRIKV